VNAKRKDEWLSVINAAHLLGVSRVTVYKKMATGELKGETHAGRIVINRALLLRYLEKRTKLQEATP